MRFALYLSLFNVVRWWSLRTCNSLVVVLHSKEVVLFWDKGLFLLIEQRWILMLNWALCSFNSWPLFAFLLYLVLISCEIKHNFCGLDVVVVLLLLIVEIYLLRLNVNILNVLLLQLRISPDCVVFLICRLDCFFLLSGDLLFEFHVPLDIIADSHHIDLLRLRGHFLLSELVVLGDRDFPHLCQVLFKVNLRLVNSFLEIAIVLCLALLCGSVCTPPWVCF